MTITIVKVDKDGRDATGEDYTHKAAPHIVEAGYMVNNPTLIQWPCGRIETGNRVQVTPAGVEFLRQKWEART